MVDWSMEASSVVDEVTPGATWVMVYVCALRIKEVIPFS